MPRWLLWDAIPQEGKKPRKVPKYATNLRNRTETGSEKDLKNLVTFDIALDRARVNALGLGFAFVSGDGIVGIDLDNCLDLETGEVTERASRLVDRFASYTEVSPSRKGLHIIVKGQTKSAKCSVAEVYSEGRFFCWTGELFTKVTSLSSPETGLFDRLHQVIEAQKEIDRKAKTPAATRGPARERTPQDEDARDMELAIEALKHIPASIMNDEWVQLGMALKDRFGDAGFDIWDQWSKTDSKYDSKEMGARWKSFKRDGVKIGTLFHMAKSNGWEPPKKADREPAPEPPPEMRDGAKKEPSKVEQAPSGFQGPPLDVFSQQELPEFPCELIPYSIGDYVKDQTDIIGSDPAIIGMTCIVSCAALIHDAFTLQPKIFENGWQESARLWGACVGEAAAKKTPGMSAALRPLNKIDKKYALEYQDEKAAYDQEKDAWERKSKRKNADPPGPPPVKPPCKRILVQQSTVEALEETLRDNPGGILCMYDELAGWFGAMDAYSGSKATSKDRPAWLQIYNGGMRRSDTISRGSLIVPNWSACMIGGIQPSAIAKIAAALPEDGLLQRFMVVCARPARAGKDRAQDHNATACYTALIEWLHGLDYTNCRPIMLSPEAIKVKERLYGFAHDLIQYKAVVGGLASFVGKWEGLFARLLLVWHMVRCFEKSGNIDPNVDEETALKVEKFMKEFLLPHAVHFYSKILGVSAMADQAKEIAGILLDHNGDTITPRDLARRSREWQRMSDVEKRAVMRTLEDADWLLVDESSMKPGRPLAGKWIVNPLAKQAYKAHAEAEKERRAKAREFVRMSKRL